MLIDDGAKALADGQKHCSNLWILNLETNSIGADGGKALADGLNHCMLYGIVLVLKVQKPFLMVKALQ